MRSFLLASIAALAIPACTQDITGGPGPGDDQQGATCGNGTVETGETCDDSNTASGDGCDSACQTETSATPKIAGAMNPITMELYNPTTAALMLTGEGGFTGTANLVYSLVDGTGTAIPGATVTGPATADLSTGTATVSLSLMVPLSATATEINGTLKVDVTGAGVDPLAVATATDIKNIFTVEYALGTGATPNNHALHGMTFEVKRGTIIHIKNSDTIVHRTHGSGAQGSTAPFAHEDLNDPTAGKPGNVYEVPTIGVAPSTTVYQLGCHDHPDAGNAEYMSFTVM